MPPIQWASPTNDNETIGLTSDWKTEIPNKTYLYPRIRKYGNPKIHHYGTNLITSFYTQLVCKIYFSEDEQKKTRSESPFFPRT